MRQLQPVLWAKGTFLTPQHLQTHDRFLEELLSFRFDALNFRPWGFSNLEINHELLAAGSFALQSASGIFPDGLLFDIPSSDEAPAPKALEFGPDEERVDVHLAIPAYRTGGRNVSGDKSGVDTRYSIEAVLVRDETTGTSERALQVARKNLRLLTAAETRAGTPSLRVARIKKAQGGVLQLDPEFVPPLLNLSASDLLMSILRRLVELLSARSSELSGARGHKNQSLADFSDADIADFWLLYTVNSWLPEIRHIFEVRRGHPEQAFRVLLALAGALTTFSNEVHPRDLPVYDHDGLGECFKQVDEKIRMLLKTVVPANFISLPLRLTKPFIYSAAIDDDKYLRGSKLYLAMSASIPEADLISKTPHFVKICSAPHLDQLIRQALPGVPLRHMPVPPAVVRMKSNYQYFSLGQSGAAWEAITRARSVAAHVPGDFPDPKLEILIVLPEALSRN